MYGDHPCTNQYRRTAESVGAITRNDLVGFHKQYFFPNNFVFAVSGDFKTKDILAKLDGMMAGWPDQKLDLAAIPAQVPDPAPGVYMIEKEDVNQSRIRIGHIGVQRDIPDQYALVVMNDILGGGGFTSRIVRRVRSDEGLAYSAGSAFELKVTLDIQDHHHINAHEPLSEFLIPTTLSMDETPGLSASQPRYPPGHREAGLLPDQPVAVYRSEIEIAVPVEADASLTGPQVRITGSRPNQIDFCLYTQPTSPEIPGCRDQRPGPAALWPHIGGSFFCCP